jgi:hypothetical protein
VSLVGVGYNPTDYSIAIRTEWSNFRFARLYALPGLIVMDLGDLAYHPYRTAFIVAGVSPWSHDGNHDNENCYIIRK